MNRGKVKKAGEQAIHSNKEYNNFSKCRGFDKTIHSMEKEVAPNEQHKSVDEPPNEEGVFTLEAMMLWGFKVIQWDGM